MQNVLSVAAEVVLIGVADRELTSRLADFALQALRLGW